MKRPKRDPIREDRIHNEAIVDANGPEEQVMGWHCYLDDKIRFPFQANQEGGNRRSPLAVFADGLATAENLANCGRLVRLSAAM
jgi:hypothetical protein